MMDIPKKVEIPLFLILLLSLASVFLGPSVGVLYLLWYVAAVLAAAVIIGLPVALVKHRFYGRRISFTGGAPVVVIAFASLILAGACVSNLATGEWGYPGF